MERTLIGDLDNLLATIARLYASEGKAREVAILAYATAHAEISGYDNWDGGTNLYTIWLEVPTVLYTQIADDKKTLEEGCTDQIQTLLRSYPKTWLERFILLPRIEAGEDWRGKAKAWVSGEGITNQGRVRSDNVAPLTCDGLLFRSKPEIHLYQALKQAGISFAPLPVFLRGGTTYQRIEPDFVLFKDGILLLVEVDGDTVHLESPAEAHTRTTMLLHEGAHVERVTAAACETPQKAAIVVQHLIGVVNKHRGNK